MRDLEGFRFEQVLGFYINRVSYLMTEEIEKRFAKEGLNIVAQDFAILMRLFQEGEVTQAKIITLMMRDKTTITRRIDGLVKKGLVERVVHPKDRRRYNIKLTGKGRELLDLAFPLASGFQKELISDIDEANKEAAVTVLKQLEQYLMGLREQSKG